MGPDWRGANMIFYAAETIAVKIDKSLVSRLSRPRRGRNRGVVRAGIDRRPIGEGKYLRINRKLMTPR